MQRQVRLSDVIGQSCIMQEHAVMGNIYKTKHILKHFEKHYNPYILYTAMVHEPFILP